MDTVIETERCSIVRLEDDDAPVFQMVYGDEEAVRWVDDGQPITLDESIRWIEVTRNNYNKRGYGMFKIVDRRTGAVIGCCGIVHPSNQTAAEVKYCFVRESWGKGFATEVVLGLIAYGKQVHGIDNFVATVAAENLASQRVLEKCGFLTGREIYNDEGVTLVFYVGSSDIQDEIITD
ncbi:MAG: GNAT family N-acetyltransferase [Chloroflexota bacterium]